ncbi:MAG: adenylosuccinate lyase [Saprospiraceae bacterium]
MLTAISPIDGRYHEKTKELSEFFSEYALIKYRVFVEIQYFIALCQHPLPQLAEFDLDKVDKLNDIFENFNLQDALYIKNIEKTTNHDVKAVEYFLKEKFDEIGISEFKEFIHFGLTSQDINNTATPLLLMHSMERVYLPFFKKIRNYINDLAMEWAGIPMLAKTHGQPASPTRLGKEMKVFVERLDNQLKLLQQIPFTAKFGGATGNFNAHHVAYASIDWQKFGNHFVTEYLGLERLQYTTQIAHYDNLSAIFQGIKRINTILLDFCKDIWTYISMEYFKQKTIKGEIGSSAMPHKVNPIDFENAEGNLGIANAIFTHLADKLPISRLQRDLTDSTVLRNVGVPMGHTLIAFRSIEKGIGKLLLNEAKLNEDLEKNWMVVAEAIQNILRREGFDKPYEALLNLTRGKASVTKQDIHEFIETLDIAPIVKEELKVITPQNYVGI